MDFARTLIQWYLQHKRDLPWRDTKDPYRIWLSEIILQQTRVAQGLPYYERFMSLFPDVVSLADADEQHVMLAWQGLGYYSRARNLHAAAKRVAYELGGSFPDNYESLLNLPGVGEYTAAAIASFAFGEQKAVVDGNVLRVLARVFDLEADIAKPAAKKEFTALATTLIAGSDPALFNQAIMEFGAMQCVPRNPDCPSCPFRDKCEAYRLGKVGRLPFKSPKAKPADRFLHYFVLEDSGGLTSVNKRVGPGIWRHLYEFPVFEASAPASEQQMFEEASARYGEVELRELSHFDTVHKLSHQNLHIRFARVRLSGMLQDGVAPSNLASLPFPAVIHNFIERHWN